VRRVNKREICKNAANSIASASVGASTIARSTWKSRPATTAAVQPVPYPGVRMRGPSANQLAT
jgi:hypothetical protein